MNSYQLRRLDLLKLYSDVRSLFESNEKLTLSEIKSLLEKENKSFLSEDLFCVLNDLLVNDGILIKNDYWEKEAQYVYLDRHYWDSSYSRHYYSFEVDNCLDKKFLLIGDTHIGNNEMESFKLLDKVYDVAIREGATKCFHLGDVFEGKGTCNLTKEEELRQLYLFLENYPKPSPEEIKTYALVGNHDEWLHGFFQLTYEHQLERCYDLRQLTKKIPSFYMFPRPYWQTSFSDVNFHFSHRLYVSALVRQKKLKTLDDFMDDKRWLDTDYNVLVSGHLHKGLIYTTNIPREKDREQIFLGVPSTSKINLESTVGYLVSLKYENEEKVREMNVTLLNSDINNKVTMGETIPWSFKEKNKTYQKIFR